jgi:hypothetical protein
VGRSLAVLAGLMLLTMPGQASAACHVSLKVKGGAGGSGLTVGMSANLVAVASGCGDVALQVVRVRVDNLGRRVGAPSRHACANPCRIHDRRTTAGGYDYQVVATSRGKRFRSKVVRVYWAGSGSGSGGAGGTGGGSGGGSGGGGSGTAKVTCTLTGSDVVNNQGASLTADPTGMTADFRPPPGGAQWHSHYDWKVPTTLVAGTASGLTITGTTSEVSPDQDIADYYDIRAPGFKEQVTNQYRKGDGSRSGPGSWSYTLPAGTAAGTTFDIIVDIVSSEVRYHFTCA